ncbi:MAG: hypothetical protein ACRD0U_08165 [Acidimicrobiales bacterium]
MRRLNMLVVSDPNRLAELAKDASPEAVALAMMVLEGDLANRAWTDQVGASLTQRDTARLLGRTEQAVSKDNRLLRVHRRDGRPVYPVVQFDGRDQRTGVADVIAAMDGAVGELALASWLTATNAALGGRRPIDALADGEVAAVLAVADRFASRMRR